MFQDPLLAEGRNAVSYSMKNGNAVVEDGQFDVEVVRGANLTCEPMDLDSSDTQDCESSGTTCIRYFEKVKNCQ